MFTEAGDNTTARYEQIQRPEPPCLLPDDDTAVERLEPIMEAHGLTHPDKRCGRKCAEAIIAALREGGQR